MTPLLDNLLNDSRLARLFSNDARHCALQLWILQIKSAQLTENRVLYGRLVPYCHSSDQWSGSKDDNFRPFDQVEAQVIRLNLYVSSTRCEHLLRELSSGATISAVSKEAGLTFSDSLEARFGATALIADDLVFRPVAYLINRDAFGEGSIASPHGGAGAFSASITQTDKGKLFRLGDHYDAALTAWAVERLNEETGLEFGGADIVRFGDLELLVFPALDDMERRLLEVNWTDAPRALVARFNPIQVPNFSGFLFRLSVTNDGQVAYSSTVTAEYEEGVFSGKFELDDQVRARADSTELEIFGFVDGNSHEGKLCCRWRIGYIREVHLQGHLVGNTTSPVKFDWLENATRPSASDRVKSALTINRGGLGFANRIGGREADPWVPANRDLVSLFARLHPAKSEGRFFQRWSQGDGEGRLQFVEWFKGLLAKYQHHQVVIFDPYFETAGLGLIVLHAISNADYIVFTSLPKPSKEDRATPIRVSPMVAIYRYVCHLLKRLELRAYGFKERLLHSKVAPAEFDAPRPSRINNLVATCEHNRHLLKHIKLRIYGLKDGRLHDRYILVMGADGLPVAGFNLSNSFQQAAENYPLLVTPIPGDVLLEVEQYKSELLREAQAAHAEDDTEKSLMRLLFDSTASPTAPRRYEPLRFLNMARAGDVLSIWTGEPSLQGLSGDPLKDCMATLGLLNDGSLVLPGNSGLCNCLTRQDGDFADFTASWEVLGEVLAHSSFGDGNFQELEHQSAFLQFLARFLDTSFSRAYEQEDKELAVVQTHLFRDTVEILLHSPYHPSHLFHATKYGALSWAEYFAVRLLWWYAADELLTVAEAQMAKLPEEPQPPDAMRLSLLSQIVSEISLSVQLDISDRQRDRLLGSGNGLLHWMGLNAIEMRLDQPGGLASVLQLVAPFACQERVQVLGWMIYHVAGNPQKAEIYSGLVAALHEALPVTITVEELRRLVDAMRGHMRQLPWTEPWLFQDVIFPLLRDARANTDDACEIWCQELAGILEPEVKEQPHPFERSREGQTTTVAAFLFANSGAARQQAILRSLHTILKRQKRIVQQPLASTSNWTRWDEALIVSMWILTFARWSEAYVRERDMTNRRLEELSRDAHELAMVRPMDEWRSYGIGKSGQLAAFLDEAEERLALINASAPQQEKS